MSLLMLQLSLCLVSVIQLTSSGPGDPRIQEMLDRILAKMKDKDVVTTPTPNGELKKM